jgi:hypothetical protein
MYFLVKINICLYLGDKVFLTIILEYIFCASVLQIVDICYYWYV